jgi:hypothetical protein
MTTWTNDELAKIGVAEELNLSSLQANGVLGKPTTIWVVWVGENLYVRPVNGRSGAWFRGTQVRHQGQIEAGGIRKEVTFVDVEPSDAIHAEIDAAYREKYSRYLQYVPPVLTPKARAATLQLLPRATGV